MQKAIIAGNWKMNPATLVEAQKLFNSLRVGLKKNRNIEVVICPPAVFLARLVSKAWSFELGAQNCFWEEKGAFTGEISPRMLKSLGCRYVIAGHSERRRYFGEIDETVNKKIKAILAAGMKAIFCIGETEEERNRGIVSDVLFSQIEKGLKGIPKIRVKEVMIAYEPVWAIGTGKNCPIEEAQTMNLLIKKIINKLYGQSIAEGLPILYGGSVDSDNGAAYLTESRMQGLLIGGASLKAKEFLKIIANVSQALLSEK